MQHTEFVAATPFQGTKHSSCLSLALHIHWELMCLGSSLTWVGTFKPEATAHNLTLASFYLLLTVHICSCQMILVPVAIYHSWGLHFLRALLIPSGAQSFATDLCDSLSPCCELTVSSPSPFCCKQCQANRSNLESSVGPRTPVPDTTLWGTLQALKDEQHYTRNYLMSVGTSSSLVPKDPVQLPTF